MARMGRDNPRAALIYQHRTSEADQAIARAVNERVEAERQAAENRQETPDDEEGPTASWHTEG